MIFPLDLWDISLLIAVIAIILLISSELLSAYYSRINILIDKSKLRRATRAVVIAFIIIAAIRIVSIIITP